MVLLFDTHAPNVLKSALLGFAYVRCRHGPQVFLKSTYVELGINSAGSFGTQGAAPVSFLAASAPSIVQPWRRGVGIAADFNMDGFSAGAPYPISGDYVLPGTPIEGWVVSYRKNATAAPTYVANKGRITMYVAVVVCLSEHGCCVHSVVPRVYVAVRCNMGTGWVAGSEMMPLDGVSCPACS